MVCISVADEFIVGLQIMRADIQRLGLRMAAEIQGRRPRTRLAVK
jgi:hypothetical protein